MLPHAYALHLYHPRASLGEASSKPAYFKVRGVGAGSNTHHRLLIQLVDIYDNDVRASIINKTYVAMAVEHGELGQR